MGICGSCEATTSVATAKLILQDGQLQEFPYPVKVSEVLQKNPSCFICNSDEMDFDDFVSAINEEEVLQPGQLYFVLPLSRLKYPLQAEEMAALAVKASLALSRSSGGKNKCGFSRKGVVPAVFSGKRAVKPSSTWGGDEELVVVEERRRRPRVGVCGSGKGRNFTSKLGAIKE
ncbi:uncharacterized protein LOC122083108 [Macadamia integrifolia]|uniref:uncharacterized protein LOC122083108 n=1 Tax=Macadamia integrifolia TaxID=60698 RepID=UPI001C4EADA1|nr:uncharacterized protein LOC122083108 [Macadamia integrifolia]